MSALWVPAYVAIGANQGDPLASVRDAFARLATLPRSKLVARSRLYKSTPLGPQDQPEFINAAAGVLTQLSAHELLSELKALERNMGREVPVQRWGPRVIDFDLCVFGSQRINTDTLTVPHAGVPVRNFVLYPLLDIAPDLDVPGHGRIRELAARISSAGITPISSQN